jgi:hypothetical protein
MRKFIAALIFVIAPVFAQAETINVFSGFSDDSRVIFRTDDNGEVHGSTAYKVNDRSWVVFKENGSSTMVNDFSELSNDRDDD